MQAAALLIAAKRADAIASEIALHTEHNIEGLKGLVNNNTALTEQIKTKTDVLAEVNQQLAALLRQAPPTGPDSEAG